jgi:hypothetical protein
MPEKDEYQYSDDADQMSDQADPQNPLDMLLQNKMMLLMIVVVAGWMIFTNFFSGEEVIKEEMTKLGIYEETTKQPEQAVAPVIKPQPIKQIEPAVVEVIKPKPEVKVAKITADPKSATIQDALAKKYEQSMQDFKVQIATLREDNIKMKQDITSTRTSIQSVTILMKRLTDSINILQKNVTKGMKRTGKLDRPLVLKDRQKVKKREITYTIRALVDGRVWLTNDLGNEKTVVVGDKLEGYGHVLRIIPDAGKVITSFGKIITYGANDQ